MSEKELDSGNFNEEINNTEKLVLVDFYATWCGPCKMLAPVVSEIAEEYKEKLEVYKVNIDENQELALKYDIMSIPTLMFFKNGEVINTSVGFRSKSELKDTINNLV
jgi:thioredoxin 1